MNPKRQLKPSFQRSKHNFRFKHTRRVVIPLFCASAISICLALAPLSQSIWHDVGVNLVADMVSLWFALFIVEIALEKDRSEIQKPARRAMMSDLIRMRRPIVHVMSLLLWDVAEQHDLPELRRAARGEGDIASILARQNLMQSPAPMRQLGVLSGRQMTWWEYISKALSPTALRLDIIIARYVSVADSKLLSTLQEFESSIFMDVLIGKILFDDDVIKEIFWRSIIQSIASFDMQIEEGLAEHNDISTITGPSSYIDFAVEQIERGNFLRNNR